MNLSCLSRSLSCDDLWHEWYYVITLVSAVLFYNLKIDLLLKRFVAFFYLFINFSIYLGNFHFFWCSHGCICSMTTTRVDFNTTLFGPLEMIISTFCLHDCISLQHILPSSVSNMRLFPLIDFKANETCVQPVPSYIIELQ